MKRPVIGITTDYDDNDLDKYVLTKHYTASVERAGGLPVLLPYGGDLSLVRQYVELCDGILLAGGSDLDPSLYGQDWHPKAVRIDPQRQQFELALLAEIEKRRVPTLGICLGSQIMNVYRGGSLVQFLPENDRVEPIEHRRGEQGWLNRHRINLVPDTSVSQSLGKTEIIANTSHKQAIDRVGRGLRVIATAPDGVIEGIEDPTLPLFVGVQWHPERMSDEEDHLKLFGMLVERAAACCELRTAAGAFSGKWVVDVPLEAAVIDFDIYCLGCEYNLRSLRADARCPECGAPVERSLWSDDVTLNYERRQALRRAAMTPVAKLQKMQVDALLFVVDAIESAATARPRGHAPTPLSGAEVCAAVLGRAREYFNDPAEAEELLNEWGVRESADVGRIVESLAHAALLPPGICQLPPGYENCFTLGRLWDDP